MGQIIARIFRRYIIIFLILVLLFLPFTTIILKVESSAISIAPIIFESLVNPAKAKSGDLLTVSISVFDFFGIEKVEAKFFHEKGYDLITLNKISESDNISKWQSQWVVHDTLFKEYKIIVTVFSTSGLNTFTELTWYDPPTPWFNFNWSYRKELNISNAVSGYPIKLIVGYNNSASSYDVHCEGHCNINFSDLRFTGSDGITLCSYWIEEQTNGNNCIVWINTSGDNKIFMYYGNSQ